MCCVNARPDGVAFRCRSNASDEGTASVTVPNGEGGSFKAKQSERGSGVNEYAVCCCILFLNPACSPEKARGGKKKLPSDQGSLAALASNTDSHQWCTLHETCHFSRTNTHCVFSLSFVVSLVHAHVSIFKNAFIRPLVEKKKHPRLYRWCFKMISSMSKHICRLSGDIMGAKRWPIIRR